MENKRENSFGSKKMLALVLVGVLVFVGAAWGVSRFVNTETLLGSFNFSKQFPKKFSSRSARRVGSAAGVGQQAVDVNLPVDRSLGVPGDAPLMQGPVDPLEGVGDRGWCRVETLVEKSQNQVRTDAVKSGDYVYWLEKGVHRLFVNLQRKNVGIGSNGQIETVATFNVVNPGNTPNVPLNNFLIVKETTLGTHFLIGARGTGMQLAIQGYGDSGDVLDFKSVPRHVPLNALLTEDWSTLPIFAWVSTCTNDVSAACLYKQETLRLESHVYGGLAPRPVEIPLDGFEVGRGSNVSADVIAGGSGEYVVRFNGGFRDLFVYREEWDLQNGNISRLLRRIGPISQSNQLLGKPGDIQWGSDFAFVNQDLKPVRYDRHTLSQSTFDGAQARNIVTRGIQHELSGQDLYMYLAGESMDIKKIAFDNNLFQTFYSSIGGSGDPIKGIEAGGGRLTWIEGSNDSTGYAIKSCPLPR